jgi:hypothetical protein
MGFTSKIKEDILVACARHCCVCHRYKGVKIEIHHIEPKEQGGKDTFENAIPLCFDCHSDAGHYFSKHPKGTKFSPNELKKHKKTWFENVKNNNIPQKEDTLIHSRFIITKDFSLIKEIVNRDLSNFPIKDILIVENESLDFIKQITKNEEYRNEEIQNILKIRKNEYVAKFPNAKEEAIDDDEHSFFYHKRTPTIDEIKKHCKTDKLSNYLIKAAVAPEKIAKIHTCYEGECAGDGNFQELYLLRPLYFKSLVITNISSEYIKFNELVTKSCNGILYQASELKDSELINFPDILIKPNQSVLIPLGSFLSDFEMFDKEEYFSNFETVSSGQYQNLNHGKIIPKKDIEFIGRNFFPTELKIEKSKVIFHQEIHQFDFNNIYWIDRHWGYGSCPHLFFKLKNGEVKYQGEILNVLPNVFHIEKFRIANNVSSLIIAELEQETTEIEYLKINNTNVYSSIKLVEGQSIELPVEQFDLIEIKGRYYTKTNTFEIMPKLRKQDLIRTWKKTMPNNVYKTQLI